MAWPIWGMVLYGYQVLYLPMLRRAGCSVSNYPWTLGWDAQDNMDADCDGTADGETYARLRRCLDAPNFNIFSNNNRYW